MSVTETMPQRVQAQLAIVRDALSQLPRDANKTGVRPMLKFGKWRGKDTWLAGYTWARLGSHPMTGRVYETVMGRGDSPEAAVEMMQAKVPGN